MARRFVVKFKSGKVHSFDADEGAEPVAVVRKHLSFFPDEEPEALEEQFYDPSLPRRFRYEPRPELLEAALSGQDGEEKEAGIAKE